MTLSIVIPHYNYGHYLPSCLDSIRSQEYTDYELIVVDDASTDGSRKILEDYASNMHQLQVIYNEKNEGILNTARKGYEKAKGKYIHFLGADDLYLPGFLSSSMKLFLENPLLSLVCSDFGYFKENPHELDVRKLLGGCTKPISFTPKEVKHSFKTTRFWIPGTTAIIKRELFEKYGWFDSKLENISDWFFYHQVALKEGVGYIPAVLVAMRHHAHSYSSVVKRDKGRRRNTYRHLLFLLSRQKELKKDFEEAALLDFIFKELYFRLLLNPRYHTFWPYMIRKKITKSFKKS